MKSIADFFPVGLRQFLGWIATKNDNWYLLIIWLELCQYQINIDNIQSCITLHQS